jgi:hypothetical protein
MALRAPGRYSQQWYYEDVLEYEVTEFPTGFAVYDPDEYYPAYTYVEDFPLVTEGILAGFYSKPADTAIPTQFRSLKIKFFNEPPESKQELFNNETASIEYEVQSMPGGLLGAPKLVTIVGWQHTWRDEWPIRLGLSYLTNCLFRPGVGAGTVFRVMKDPIAFWQSERFLPLGGHYDPYLVGSSQWVGGGPGPTG